ncbi:HNH endonuclease [Streptomyces phage Hydra]|uniref:HNH endonuclease n=1 Tax=Streptomyces phage Hydra TaxID=1690428 RepID=A0A0K1Y8U5_9CAUD|nr:HNH endonuclease [Streptomyces phage Hydra]AKY03535.1 HNH endonuclease [Streptomyces phage Hydra]
MLNDNKLPARFWNKVSVSESGCWEWAAYRDRHGYGAFYWEGKDRRAHRVSFSVLSRPIPDGMEIDHLCRNRSCVNPAHLEPVTQTENIDRGENHIGVNRTKTHCAQGHPLVEGNLVLNKLKLGHRYCLTCQRARNAENKRRKRLAVA